MTETVAHCSCQAPLVRRNGRDRCVRCGGPVEADGSPPVVPRELWETADMQSALRSRHMGKVIRAYRHHHHHGYLGLSQTEVAAWAGISQGQVSRLETGPPLMRLGQLIGWSLLLGIPQQHLWFDLPDQDVPEASGGRGGYRHE